MIFSAEQRKIAYNKLPPDIQDLAMSTETTELITSSLNEIGLSSEQSSLADTEILYALLCMQSLDDAINNIAELSGKNVSDLAELKSTIQNNILDKYTIDIGEFVKMNESSMASQTSNQASLPEVAPKILPMVEEGEVAHNVPLPEEREEHADPKEAPVPANLPTEESRPAASPGPKPANIPATLPTPPKSAYPSGQDPYREPIE